MADTQLESRLGPALFEHAPCLVAVLDSRYRIVCANAAFERAFGRRGEGEPCYAVYKGRSAPCEQCVAAQVFADGNGHCSEEEGRDVQHQPLLYRVHAVPDIGADGGVQHVLQISVDLTHERELEQGLAQAERLANVGMTTAGLAHTIKNILGGLEGGSYVVSSGLQRDDQERVRGGWSMVEKYIEQVTTLVRNLLSFARAEEPTREEVDPRDLVQQVTELYASKADLIGISVEAEVEEGVAAVWADPQRIRACLSNLVTNAIDACSWDPDTDKEHRVRISARRREGGGAVLEVSDNGMGIPEESQPKILRSYFTTKGIRGTGLGLLLTKKTVEEHSGSISFSSTPGAGTTFRIELPSRPPEDTVKKDGEADDVHAPPARSNCCSQEATP